MRSLGVALYLRLVCDNRASSSLSSSAWVVHRAPRRSRGKINRSRQDSADFATRLRLVPGRGGAGSGISTTGCTATCIASRSTASGRSHASQNLDERTDIGAHILCRGVGLAEVPHSAVIHDPGAAVRSHPDVGGSVEATKACSKVVLCANRTVFSANGWSGALKLMSLI